MNDQTAARPLTTIVLAGLVAGALDITSAFVILGLRGIGPTRVLQGVAAGLLGRSSLEGGIGTAVLGLALHFFIALTAATVFYLASRRIAFLTRQPVVAGLLYGVGVYAVMNFIVLPLSAIKPHYTASGMTIGVLVIMFMVGLPI
ncbi:MAG: hypothetical protein JWN02_336, partial [Acidobacteria bacterium]|nr:hypothetical protein [Acidobacteriota bacterium]